MLVLERAASSLDVVLSGLSLVDTAPLPGGPALLVQICEGLAQLHGAGWVHGDLKPGNVLLMADGSVRLADFGLAAELDGTHAYSPAFATPDYSPPELVWSEIGERGRVVRPATDIWAFGVLAHVVLTGTLPLPGSSAGSRREALVRYALGKGAPTLSPSLPPAWRAVVADCLTRAPADRAAYTAEALLPRVLAAARATTEVPRPRRLALAAALAVAILVGAAGGFGVANLRDPVSVTGYHRCPANSACFFAEQDGNGEMCSWTAASTDWTKSCAWADERPVRSVFNNADEFDPFHALVYYQLSGYQQRKGCTSVHSQGNLAGTYRVQSHRWQTSCAQ